MRYYLLYLVTAMLACVVCGTANSSQRSALHDSVLTGYNRRIYPDVQGGGPVQISVHFTLMALKEFDVQMSRFSVSGFLTSSWKDERLKWLPSDHYGITSLHVYQGEIWTPCFVLWNSDESLDKLGYNDAPVRISSDGSVIWNPGEVFVTSCNADVTYFPFDIQCCTMDFIPYGYNMDEVNLTTDVYLASTDEPTLNTMWEVLHTKLYVTDKNHEHMLHVSITFRRRGLIFVLLVIMPVVLMSLVNLATFFIPVEEGNRIDFATTMLLTISVSMTVVGSYLPQSSLPQISIMCYMVSIHVFISMLVMVFAVKSVQIYHKPDTEAISATAKLFTKIMCKGREKTTIVSPEFKEHNKVEEFEKPKWVTSSDAEEMNDDGKYTTKDDSPSRTDLDDNITWRDVGSSFDRFSFLVFILLIGILDTVTVTIVARGGDVKVLI
ncbi:acetylcholine receptor subunit beta-like [Argopecten irradians]|uniref:acetylcholine receptor subunit beta-like n=1 Tax=Argopecten irradians TaxID=31199 RepID=UPI003721C75E